MRPLAVLNAIVFGSAAAITFGLGGVLVIFLVLQGQYPADARGIPCRWCAAARCSPLLAAVSGASLFGMLKGWRWRWLAQAAMWLVVAGIAALYWPRVSSGTWGKPPKSRAICARAKARRRVARQLVSAC